MVKTWRITFEIESDECKFKYRKWNPPRDTWFCKKTGDKCLKNKCPLKKE